MSLRITAPMAAASAAVHEALARSLFRDVEVLRLAEAPREGRYVAVTGAVDFGDHELAFYAVVEPARPAESEPARFVAARLGEDSLLVADKSGKNVEVVSRPGAIAAPVAAPPPAPIHLVVLGTRARAPSAPIVAALEATIAAQGNRVRAWDVRGTDGLLHASCYGTDGQLMVHDTMGDAQLMVRNADCAVIPFNPWCPASGHAAVALRDWYLKCNGAEAPYLFVGDASSGDITIPTLGEMFPPELQSFGLAGAVHVLAISIKTRHSMRAVLRLARHLALQSRDQ